MGTITANPAITPLSLLTAPGGPLSSASSFVPQSVLNSASPGELAGLSTAAESLSEANLLYGATSPDLFQSNDLFQSSNPTLSLLDAAYGFTPTTTGTPDLLQEGLANLNGTPVSQTPSIVSPPTLNQNLLSLFGNGTSNSGNLINTTG